MVVADISAEGADHNECFCNDLVDVYDFNALNKMLWKCASECPQATRAVDFICESLDEFLDSCDTDHPEAHTEYGSEDDTDMEDGTLEGKGSEDGGSGDDSSEDGGF